MTKQTTFTGKKCCGWICFIWFLLMAKLLYNVSEIEYLNNDPEHYYFEYTYFIFYSIISWNIFEFNNIFAIYDKPTHFWTKLEEQFNRLQVPQDTVQQTMDVTNDIHNTYTTNKSSPSSAYLKYIEIDASSTNFNYSYSDLYKLSHEYSKPVVLRSLIPMSYKSDHVLLDILHKHGNKKVPVMWNKNQSSLRFQDAMVSHDYSQFDGPTLHSIFLNKDIPEYTSYDMVKFWHICDKHNTSELWQYFNLNILQIPDSELAAAGLFISNLPPKPPTHSDFDEWYLSADFHSDVGPSFFVQLAGRKLWRLVDLKYTHLMRPIWYGTYGRSFAYNAEHFDLIPRYEMILNEGDVIFFPPWIWHEACIDHNSGVEISCGIKMFREPNMLVNMKISGLLTVNTLGSVARDTLFGNGRSKTC